MKYIYLALIAGLVSQIAWAVDLPGGFEKQNIVVGTAIKIDARTAPQVIGSRGIAVGTCRQLEGGPLALKGVNGQTYQLADGIYESKDGIRIHVRNSSIIKISSSRDLSR